MKNTAILFITILLCLTAFFTENGQAQTICSDETGIHDGYDYELWKGENGSACMTLQPGGSFSCEWSNVLNMYCRKGYKLYSIQTYKQLGSISITYGCDYQPDGNSYLTAYGWMERPRVEYYIVDSWGTWRPPGASPKGTITVDEGTYDIYKTSMTGSPELYEQYWSVRRSKRTSGTISVAKHFSKWESLGMTLGEISEVSLMIEGYESSGKADVYSMSIDFHDDADYTEITAPFVQDGTGNFRWMTSSIPSYVSSWNLDSLTINGIDYTNAWVLASNLPDKQNGHYYIEYKGSYAWSHVEIK